MKTEKHIIKGHFKGKRPHVKVTAYELSAVDCSADRMSGYYSQESTLISDDPEPGYDFAGWSVTGSNVTGNNVRFEGDITAKANYSAHVYNVTLQNDGHGTIAANKNTGNIGDTITLSNSPSTNYGFSGYSITGATLTSNQFKIGTNDVTAKGWFSALPAYTLTLQTDGHGKIGAGKTTGYQGDTTTLSNTASANYQFSGYTVTGATLNGSTLTFGAQDATAKAWFSENKSALYYNGSLRLNNLGNTNWSQSGALNVNRNTAFRYTTFLCTNRFYNDVLISISSNNTLWQLCQPNGSESLTANYRATKFGLSNNSAGQLVGTSTNAYNTTCSNRKGSYCRFTLYKMSPSINAKYKLVIDNDVKSASAYWNNNYVGYQSADMTAIKSICAESVENYGNNRWWDISAIRIAGFKDFTAATAYNG